MEKHKDCIKACERAKDVGMEWYACAHNCQRKREQKARTEEAVVWIVALLASFTAGFALATHFVA